MHRPLVFLGYALVFLGYALATPIAVAQSQAATSVHDVLELRLSELRRIEASVLPPVIVEGPPSHESLHEYFRAANPRLRARLVAAREAFARPESHPFSALTIVAGAAGVGKTFIKGEVYGDIPRDQVWKFDIRELFGEFMDADLAELNPDLVCGHHVFNRLLSLTEQGRQAFQDHVQRHFKPFTVVDSVDEIHPADYEFVLRVLQHQALDSNRSFANLVVFGRPIAFHDYWIASGKSSDRSEIQTYVLHKPQFRTTGDLTVSNWNYDRWKHSLHLETAGTSEPMPFNQYRLWSAKGYPSTADFAALAYEPNDHMTRDARALLRDWAMNHQVVASVLPNLAGNGIVRDISVMNHLQGRPYNEREFMAEFFARWLERDTKSDDRPSRHKPTLLPKYLRLLESVAVNTLLEGSMDESGYFDVGNDWIFTSIDGGTPIRAIEILNRSGLVSVDPRDPYSERFRFEPVWLHRMLVERFLRRHSDRIVQARQ